MFGVKIDFYIALSVGILSILPHEFARNKASPPLSLFFFLGEIRRIITNEDHERMLKISVERCPKRGIFKIYPALLKCLLSVGRSGHE